VLALALVLGASPVFAQRTEIALMGGYTTAGDIDQKAPGIEELEVAGSFTWGVAATRSLTDHFGVEVSWSQQRSALRLGTSAGSAELFDMTLGRLEAGAVYRFGAPPARLAPFLLAAAGVARLDAADLEAETKLAWSLGAGVKWLASERLGARLQVRYVPTVLGGSSSDVCDPFGFCQGLLHQLEITGGVVLRF
jgi:hypothetical protein